MRRVRNTLGKRYTRVMDEPFTRVKIRRRGARTVCRRAQV